MVSAACMKLSLVLLVHVVASVTFLLTVNDTWYPDEYNETCLQTVKTPPIRPNGKWNESRSIQVGKCDYGALTFQVTEGK